MNTKPSRLKQSVITAVEDLSVAVNGGRSDREISRRAQIYLARLREFGKQGGTVTYQDKVEVNA